MTTANDLRKAEVDLKKAKEDAALTLRSYLKVSTVSPELSKTESEKFVEYLLQAVAAQGYLVHLRVKEKMENARHERNPASSGHDGSQHGV